ncbi:MAG TPA: SAM-dependent methyltransferase [Actinomycetota bacterium]|nr:SAM-dependent methyltransferase [Actinomycetota bacterium]
MGTAPIDRIRRAIARRGPITFAEFMEEALYGEGGFYAEPPVGPHGHFVTSPHVHPVFATLLARALREAWGALGRPDPFPVVEVGAGDGTLARALHDELADLPVRYVGVERSPGAREALGRLPLAAVVEEIGRAAPIRDGVVLANELLDNLPFRVVRRRGAPRVARGAAGDPMRGPAEGATDLETGQPGEPGPLVEVLVGDGPAGLVEVEAPCPPELAALAPELAPGEEAAVPTGALAFVDALAGALERGYALLVDYGSAEGRSPGPVHGYRGHRLVERVLEDPGGTDVTAGVDFLALSRRARAVGLEVLALLDQRDALLALGFEGWLRDELRRQRELLDAGRGLEAVRAWGGRSRATLLVEPAGLGRLRWLLLATPGLPAPGWLPGGGDRRTADRPAAG